MIYSQISLFLRWVGHQNWLKEGIRYRLISKVSKVIPHRIKTFEVPFFGYSYSGFFENFIDWWVYYFGLYEKNDQFFFRKLGHAFYTKHKRKPVFYDIGANVGCHALFASTYCEKVYAFEPYEVVRTQLAQKIAYNQIKNIQVFSVGLGVEDKNLAFIAPEKSNTGTGYFHESTGESELFLPIRNGDEFINKNQLTPPDFIKIDVEGFEPFVLNGLKQSIAKYNPILCIELSDKCEENLIKEGISDITYLVGENYRVFRVFNNKVVESTLDFNGFNYFFIPNSFQI